MEFHQLRSLVSLAELGTIANASRRLYRSSAAVHKQLKILEEELEVRLYQKNGRGLQLTQAAALLLPYAREILAQHDSALAAIKEWKGLKRGLVRIGSGPTLSSYVLPRLLMRYRHLHQNIELIVESGSSHALIEALANGELDLALLVSPLLEEEPPLVVQKAWEFEFVLVCNTPHAPLHCSIRDLNKFPFILYRKGSRMENLVDRYFVEIGFRPKVTMTFDNAEAIKAMVRAGLGISMLPLWIVDADLQKRSLFLIHQREKPLYSKIELVQRRTNFVPSAVSAFIDLAHSFAFRTPRLTRAKPKLGVGEQ